MRVKRLIGLWAIILCCGLYGMARYDMSAGDAGSPPETWPAAAEVTTHVQYPTLLLFAHPKCPCTSATISELERLIARCHGAVETYVVFLKPADTPDGWERTRLWNTASAIPGVHVISDKSSQLSRLFAISTSGTAVMYDTNGQRVFHGGLTASRGHEGSNVGCETIQALINNETAQHTKTPVFGCELCNRTQSTY